MNARFALLIAAAAAVCTLFAPLAFSGVNGKEPEPTLTRPPAAAAAPPKPRPSQLAWQEAELVALFSIDPRIYNNTYNRQALVAAAPIKDPFGYANKFNPTRLDTDQWAAAAKAMGAKFAILVAKHETGLCLWQSDADPFCLKNIKWRDGKADIVRDFVASCRKHGLKPGVFTEARQDLRLAVAEFRVSAKSPVTQDQYNRLVEREVEELCTRYGELFEFWLDAGALCAERGGPTLVPIVEKHQPHTLFYHSPQRADARWGGTETGTVSYPCWATTCRRILWEQDPSKKAPRDVLQKLMCHGDPGGSDWCPAMSDAPMRCENGRHDWFWAPGGEQSVASLKTLQAMYHGSVGRNSTLIIGLTPDRTGLVPAPDVARCKEFGDWIGKTFGGKPLAATSGNGTELTLELPAKGSATYVILQEDIADGEHVRQYIVEAKQGDLWKTLCTGSCIGHKRIEQIPPCDARAFRLRIIESAGPVAIRSFSIR